MRPGWKEWLALFVLLAGVLSCQGSDTHVVDAGEDTSDGVDSLDGADASDAEDGLDGVDASDEADGSDAEDGVDGVDASDGEDGVDGQDGSDGEDGGQGDGPVDCEHPCLNEGWRYCTPTGYIVCERVAADCLSWREVDCPAGQACSTFFSEGGEVRCSAECEDECFPPDGWGRCEEGDPSWLHIQCGDYDDDSCNDYAVLEICPEGMLCYGETGCITCLDDCLEEGFRGCTSNISFLVCGYFDEDTCLDYEEGFCGEDETCDSESGLCVCIDGCFVQGAHRCVDYYSTELCDDFDEDDCIEWGEHLQCPEGETCQDGVCSTECSNECPYEGDHECYGGYSKRRICGYWDTDSCRDWSLIEDCPDGTVCWIGAAPGDPCVECYGDGRECMPAIEVCRDNECVPPPGQCFLPTGTSGFEIEVTRSEPVTRFTLFFGFTEVYTAEISSIRMQAPDGTHASIMECQTLPGGEVFWDTFDSEDIPDLVQFLGQSAQGVWTLMTMNCTVEPGPHLETWAICLEF